MMSLDSDFLARSSELQLTLESQVSRSKDPQLKVKIKQRSAKRQSLTKTIATLTSSTLEDECEIVFLIDKLETLKASLLELDTVIEELMLTGELWSADDHAKQIDLCDSYADKLGANLSRLKLLLRDKQVVTSVDSHVTTRVPSQLSRLKLPEIELPKFSGQPELFEKFIVSIEDILGKFNLTQFEKFSYLKQRVSGPALQILNSVPITSNVYDDARKLLSDAFASKINQQFSVIEQMVHLKFDAKNPFQWVAETRSLVDQVNRLEINSDVFCQYHLWKSLPEAVKCSYMNITNCSKPALDQILKHSFEVLERLKNATSSLTEPRVSHPSLPNKSSMATDVQYAKSSKTSQGKICWLCESVRDPRAADHKIANCPVFNTPEARLTKIRSSGGCVKCGWLTHDASSCKFNFRSKCRICNTNHAFFLCTKVTKPSSGPAADSASQCASHLAPKPKSTNVVEFNVMETQTNENILIPTFTALSNKTSLRCMYDPASQTTFLTERAASRLKARVVKRNVRIKIAGFNATKVLTTKLVEFPLQLKKRVTVTAVVVPEIRTRVNTCGLEELITKAKELKIPLADRMMRPDDPGIVDILLGVDFAQILPVHSCSFGNSSHLSLVYYCSQGIMLAGDVTVLRRNLPHLHLVKTFMRKIDSIV